MVHRPYLLAGRHCGLEHVEVLRGVLVVAHLLRALVAELQLLLADDEAAYILRRVVGAGLEDCDIDPLVRLVDLHLEVGLHVVDGDVFGSFNV